jgi:hypothetical protein
MKWSRTKALAVAALGLLSLSSLSVFAQEKPPVDEAGNQVATEKTPAAASNSEELRKESQNPIANLISFPIQENGNFGIGVANRVQNVLNIQPVIPFSAGKNWNLITRWITPIVYQPIPVPQETGPPSEVTGVSGLGDINPSFILSPKKSKVIWGVGVTIVFPTATNTTYLGQGKLSVGPTAVMLFQPTHFTLGFLTNNYWSVTGHSNLDKPAVNQFLLQYFINYNMKKGWYLKTAPIVTSNWRAPSGSKWNVPLGGGFGRIMKLGFQPVNLSAEFYGNAVHPPGASSWTARFSLTLLFPKLTPQMEKMMLMQKLKQMDEAPPQQKN